MDFAGSGVVHMTGQGVAFQGSGIQGLLAVQGCEIWVLSSRNRLGCFSLHKFMVLGATWGWFRDVQFFSTRKNPCHAIPACERSVGNHFSLGPSDSRFVKSVVAW